MRKSCVYTAIQAVKEYGNKSIHIEDKNATEGNSRNVRKELNDIIPCLSEYLKIAGEDFIDLNLNSSIDPCILTPVGNDSFIYLVLPVRINA